MKIKKRQIKIIISTNTENKAKQLTKLSNIYEQKAKAKAQSKADRREDSSPAIRVRPALKQDRRITLQRWESGAQNESRRAKIPMLAPD